jgi:hypothetical protein
MGRIVVFDQHTREKLPYDLGAVAELSFGLYSRDTMEYLTPILAMDREALVVIPSTIEGCVCTIRLRPVLKPDVQALPFEPESISEPEASDEVGQSDERQSFVEAAQLFETEPLPGLESSVQAETNFEPQYEATGFLGLSDTLSEPERPRRWWHWFWS